LLGVESPVESVGGAEEGMGLGGFTSALLSLPNASSSISFIMISNVQVFGFYRGIH
jgi:hypothetical protein